MKSIRKIALISTFTIVGLCLSGALLVLYRGVVKNFERDIYSWWVSRALPKPDVFQVALSRRTVLKIYPNTNDILWLGTKWTDDGKYIQVSESRSQVYANNIMVIDPKNPIYNNEIKSIQGGNIFGLVNTLPFTLENREYLWGACQNENIFFTAKYVDNNLWETRLWKDKQLIKTFQPVEIRFGDYQSGFRDEPVGVTVEFSNFSPDCRYFTIDSYKNTWILDTVNQSFSPLKINGTQLLFDHLSIDMSCYQCVRPVWSPNSREFVFNSNNGIEKYDIDLNKRSWLVAPENNAGVWQWSKTGNWILGFLNQSGSLISSDGNRIGILQGCEDIKHPSWSSKDIHTFTEYPSWSPTEDKFAFICNQYDQSTCTEGKCEKSESFLIIWDLSNLDSH
jgi:hypothetical protein